MGSPDTVPLWAATGASTSEAAVEGLIEILPALVDDLRRMDVASADALARLRPEDPHLATTDTP
ncbi:MAG: hypothetical protein M3O88_05775, partial [Actinomycetota bacterium]|nr:hypothetical protein [Actinomycetota bacterium]